MIVVIADDFSGAAEIAGIAWRFGLSVSLLTKLDLSVHHDLLVVDTGSRSMDEESSRKVHKALSRDLRNMKCDWIFKKTDSVLRGHVIAEIEALNSELNKKNVLMISNNPAMGKKIKNGSYYINEVALNQTDFAHDPDFPAKSALVRDILGANKTMPLKYVSSIEMPAGKGLLVPDVVKSEELNQWSSLLSDAVLPAGGSEFFEAILVTKGLKAGKNIKNKTAMTQKKRFLVFASTAEKSKKTILKLKDTGIPVCNFPGKSISTPEFSEECLNRWIDDIKTCFKNNNTVMSAILHPVNRARGISKILNQLVTEMIRQVLASEDPDELFIEGGATISHLIRTIGWDTFEVAGEYERGIVELKVLNKTGLRLFVKPGSYTWPDEILNN
jgi:uncharacterized protein YgbK (DUF1537 family)